MSSSNPGLPEVPVLQADDSMLTKRFGKEVVNYYAGGRLNRYSFLRSDSKFLRNAATSPKAQYIALNSLSALTTSPSQLAYFGYKDFEPLLGSDLFKISEEQFIEKFDSTVYRPLLVFLGLLEDVEGAVALETSDHGVVNGQPFFAVDITPRSSVTESAEAFIKQQEDKGIKTQSNPRQMSLQPDLGKTVFIAGHAFHSASAYSFCSRHLCSSQVHGRLEHPKRLLRRLWQSYAIRPRRLQARVPA